LIRHTLYAELSPPRQVRLHRQIAEAMERTYRDRAISFAGELAYQFHRSGGLPGTERGVGYALAAADRAETNGAWDEAATYVRMALGMLGDGDARRASITGRLGISLAWALSFDEAARTAGTAADLIEASEGPAPAADYLCAAARALWSGGAQAAAWPLASRGLRLLGDRRDATWAWMKAYDLQRAAAEDRTHPGIALDSPAQREWSASSTQSGLPRPDATNCSWPGR
jgi:hypothetical protein